MQGTPRVQRDLRRVPAEQSRVRGSHLLRPVAHFVGVLGWPLEHTLSPTIHNAAFRNMGLDWVYLAWPVDPDDLGRAI
ncbi:MAG TPA: hypothetical protein VEV82_03450, partial [Actinomycetota bacterium]|nr:hypothetical protein [Actinomycetota bacterium]